MVGHWGYNLGFNYHRFINLYRVGVFIAITGDEGLPSITKQTQLINNDELNKPMMKQAVISLVPLIFFGHLIQAPMKIEWHV
jgi:hypothetical protein